MLLGVTYTGCKVQLRISDSKTRRVVGAAKDTYGSQEMMRLRKQNKELSKRFLPLISSSSAVILSIADPCKRPNTPVTHCSAVVDPPVQLETRTSKRPPPPHGRDSCNPPCQCRSEIAKQNGPQLRPARAPCGLQRVSSSRGVQFWRFIRGTAGPGWPAAAVLVDIFGSDATMVERLPFHRQ